MASGGRDSFTFGDLSTLPYAPMEYITRQSQGDFCILDQRDGNLWMDAGMVTTQADWSLDFVAGSLLRRDCLALVSRCGMVLPLGFPYSSAQWNRLNIWNGSWSLSSPPTWWGTAA